jgi:hypothetical protein
MAALFVLVGAVSTKADSVTDPATNVAYTLTSSFVPDSNNMFDVTLTIDASHFSATSGATSGFLSALAVQFPTNTVTSVVLSEPGGMDLWGNKQAAPNGACDYSTINGLGVGFLCSANTSLNTVGAVPGTLTFVYGLVQPVASANIFALYAQTSNGAGLITGDNIIGETPVTNVPIQSTSSSGGTGGSSGGGGGTTVPEPGVLTLVSIGLVAFVLFHRALVARLKVSTI